MLITPKGGEGQILPSPSLFSIPKAFFGRYTYINPKLLKITINHFLIRALLLEIASPIGRICYFKGSIAFNFVTLLILTITYSKLFHICDKQ